MRCLRRKIVVLTCGVLLAGACEAGWKDLLPPLDQTASQLGAGQQAAGLSEGEIAAGLKEALSTGVGRAVEALGRPGGFLEDAEVRIPMPSALRQVEQGLRAMGQGQLVDEFVSTMNEAAELAVPETVSIFGDAIEAMTLEDAKAILNGPSDAATRFFEQQSGQRLIETVKPIVEQTTQKAGVTAAYKSLVAKAGFMGGLVDPQSLDLDGYVSAQAVDGLFVKLAEEERRIREDPVARSTELLKKVFAGKSD